jgi:hypothetical protein
MRSFVRSFCMWKSSQVVLINQLITHQKNSANSVNSVKTAAQTIELFRAIPARATYSMQL